MTPADDLTRQLAQCHRELGELVAAEKQGRIEAYMHSDESSVTGRERDADASTLPLAVDILKLKAEIRALEVEWEHAMAVEHGSRPGR